MSVSNKTYTAFAMLLHWLMAIGIIGLIVVGLLMTHGSIAAVTKFKLYQLHKSVGITVLALAVVRLGWRALHRPPALPATMPRLERTMAAASHHLLYLLMIGLPLAGWALVSVSPLKIPTILYGLVQWPDLPIVGSAAAKARWATIFDAVHSYGAWALAGLILLHAAAALRHHFISRDDVLSRMLPFGKPATSAEPEKPKTIGSAA